MLIASTQSNCHSAKHPYLLSGVLRLESNLELNSNDD